MGFRCVFVGDIGDGVYRSGASRLRAVEKLGVDVVPFDTTGWTGGNHVTARINRRLFMGRKVRRLNADLRTLVEKARPDVVWVDKGLWLHPNTLGTMRGATRMLLHYSTDDVFAQASQNWLHRAQLPYYDLYLTTNRQNVVEFNRSRRVRAVRVGMGYDANHHPSEPATVDREPLVVFIGHWEPATDRLVNALTTAGVTVRVWGANWEKSTNPLFRTAGFLPQEQYASTIQGARLALCCLSKWNRNESTGRSFEIPAMGATLLAERTAEHAYLFRHKVEALLFDDEHDLVRLATTYMPRPDASLQIATAGQARCLSLGMSWADHLRREWRIVERGIEGDFRLSPDDDAPFWPGYRSGRGYVGPPR